MLLPFGVNALLLDSMAHEREGLQARDGTMKQPI